MSGAAEQKSFYEADEIRTFNRGRAEVIHIGGGDVMRLTLEPGWKWSADVKPTAGTELCEAPHFQYIVSGTMAVEMADGQQLEIGPGEVCVLPSGHDAWVIGDEPVIAVDWRGASAWGKAH